MEEALPSLTLSLSVEAMAMVSQVCLFSPFAISFSSRFEHVYCLFWFVV